MSRSFVHPTQYVSLLALRFNCDRAINDDVVANVCTMTAMFFWYFPRNTRLKPYFMHIADDDILHLRFTFLHCLELRSDPNAYLMTRFLVM